MKKIFRAKLSILLVLLGLTAAFASVYCVYGRGHGLNQDPDLPGGAYSLQELRTKHQQRRGLKRIEANLWYAYQRVPEFRSVVDQAVARHKITTHVWVGSAAAVLDHAIMQAAEIPTQQLKQGQKLLLVSARHGPSLWRKWTITRDAKDGDYFAIKATIWDVQLDVGILKICGNIIVLPPSLRPPKVAATPTPRPTPTPTPDQPLETDVPGPVPQYVFSEQGPGGTSGQWIQPVVPGNPIFIPVPPKPVAPPAPTGRTATITVGSQTIQLAVANSVSSSSAVAVTAGGGTSAGAGNGSAAGGANGTITTPPIVITFPGG